MENLDPAPEIPPDIWEELKRMERAQQAIMKSFLDIFCTQPEPGVARALKRIEQMQNSKGGKHA